MPSEPAASAKCLDCHRGRPPQRTCTLVYDQPQDQGYDTYCVLCLWIASDSLDTRTTSIDSLYLNSLGDKYGWSRITPEVIKRYVGNNGCMDRIMNEDVNVPVLVARTTRGLEVLDGRFRVVRAVYDSHNFIQTIEIPATVRARCTVKK